MKILRILGIVVGVHAAAFMFVFAIPGCRSTTRRASSEKPTVEAKTTTIHFDGVTHHASSSRPPNAGREVTPATEALPSSGSTDTGGSTIIFPAAMSGARQNPTRPDNPASGSLQTAPAAEVTPVVTYTVVPKDSLWTLAKRFKISEKELASANNLRSGSPLKVGQRLIIPQASSASPTTATTSTAAALPSTLNYRVKAGDSLAGIARRAGTTTAELRTLNRLTSDVLTVGQELALPASSTTNAANATTDDAANVEPIVPVKNAPRVAKPGQVKHTVKSGESLGQIARRYGVPLRDVATANHIANPASLRVGAELIIPLPAGKSAPQTAPSGNTAGTNVSRTPEPTHTPQPTPVPETPLVAPAQDSNPISPATSDAPPVNQVEDGGLISPGAE